jgi:hypothetical protein
MIDPYVTNTQVTINIFTRLWAIRSLRTGVLFEYPATRCWTWDSESSLTVVRGDPDGVELKEDDNQEMKK